MVSWPFLLDEIKDCSKCKLCETRNSIVLGEGNYYAKVMFIGKGPVRRRTGREGRLWGPRGSCWIRCWRQSALIGRRFILPIL